MKQYRLWALDVPDLDPRGFTHCGNRKIRLYDGGDGGGGGDSGGMDQAAAEAAMDAALAAEAGPAVGESSNAGVGDIAALAAELGLTVDSQGNVTSGIGLGDVSNAVTDSFGNPITDGFGNPIASAGLNISLGLAPNTPGFHPDIQQTPPANQMTLGAAAQALGMSPQDLAAVQAQTGFVTGVPSMVSTTGLDLTTLNQLSEMGLGSTPVSNTQTVDEAIASMHAHTFLNENIDTIMGMMVPGAGAMISGTQALGGLLSGVLTPQQALGHALGPVAGAVVPGLAGSILSSDAFGQATGLTPMNEAQLAAVVASPTEAATGVSDADNTSGGSGNEVSVAPTTSPVESTPSSGSGGLEALAALFSMYQPQEAQRQDIRTVMAVPSPFGEGPYGLRNSTPYA